MKTALYIPRSYRQTCKQGDLVNFTVRVAQTDLFIRAETDLASIALPFLVQIHEDIRSYIDSNVSFLTSLTPITVPDSVPLIVKRMVQASWKFDVGPMATVAGAISQETARYLQSYSGNILIENGGDLYAINDHPITVSICFDPGDPSNRFLFELEACPQGIGVCTSSGIVGHSFSRGKAHAVTVICQSAYHADGAATALCNMIQSEADIDKTIEHARNYQEIVGLIIVMKKRIGIFGNILKVI